MSTNTPDHGTVPSRRRLALAVVGLAWFAIALPLGRILLDAPEFFIAHGRSPHQTLGFWIVVSVAIPALLGLTSRLVAEVAPSLHLVLIALIGGLAAASALQPLSATAPLFLLAVVAGGIAIAWFLPRRKALTDVVAVASVGCLALVGLAAGPTRTGAYVRAGRATVKTQASSRQRLAPVVVVVFDEFPVSSLLGSDLRVNAQRYPNFAALAATSDWFRLASSVSPNTQFSVPALLSSTVPDPAKVPVASAYPSNLFLQLARTHDVHGFESLTALCPPAVCLHPTKEPAATGGTDDLAAMLSDTAVVYRHALGTDAMRRSLPSISSSWSSFDPAVVHEDGAARKLVFDRSTFVRETDALVDLVRSPRSKHRPPLYVAHVTAPHAPWLASPDGSTYVPTQPPGAHVEDGVLDWEAAEGPRRAGYQRMLLQVGALDRRLGEVRAALTDEGIWDDAMVVVTADHGTQFEPGYWRDIEAGGVEVSGVPFFVKRPGQAKGRIDDRAALTIDLLPTVLGQIGVTSSSRFAGLDLYHAPIPKHRDHAFVRRGASSVTPVQTTGALRALVRRRARWIDPDGGWSPVRQPGVRDAVVGRSIDEVGARRGQGGTWKRLVGEGGPKVTVDLAVNPGTSPTIALVRCGPLVLAASPLDQTGKAVHLEAFIDPSSCADRSLAISYLDGTGDRFDPRRIS